MADPQTAAQFFGPAAPGASPTPGALPTADQFFAPANDTHAGAAHDVVWSNLQSVGARILKSVGYGAQQGWGSDPLDIDDKTKADLTRMGVFNDWSQNRASFYKSFNESVLRGAAQTEQVVTRGLSAGFEGVKGGLRQAQIEAQHGSTNEAPETPLAYAFAASREALEDVQGGALAELPAMAHGVTLADIPGALPDLATAGAEDAAGAGRAQAAASARASGVVGEGEAGYYEAAPLTPENAAARTEAAGEVAVEPPPPLPAAPDLHILARRVEPDLFDRYDGLSAERDAAKGEIARLGAQDREGLPEVQDARRELNALIGLEPDSVVRGGAFEERLRAMAASAPDEMLDRVASAYDRLDRALTEDTLELGAARQRWMQADLAMRDLAPDVSAAYRHAAEMTPEPLPLEAAAETPVKTGEAAAKVGEAGLANVSPETEQTAAEPMPGVPEPEARGAVAAAADQESAAQPANVLGDQTLGEPGKPAAPGRGSHALKAVEGTGETKTRSLAEGVEAKAIEDGLATTFGDLPEYRTLSMAEQAQGAAELIDKDWDLAKAVAMGERAAPKGLLPESVFVGVEKRALAMGDVDTLRQLGTRSKLSTAATTMGQRIRTLGERDQASPVGAIQDVQKAREAHLAKNNIDIAKETADTAKEIKAEVKKAATRRVDAWNDFLAGIRCED